MSSSPHLTKWILVATLVLGPTLVGCGSTSSGDCVEDPISGEIVTEWRTFEDTTAGLAYQIPASWPEPLTEDLLSFLTSIAAPEEILGVDEAFEEIVVVGAGQLEATFFNPEPGGLDRAAFGLAATTAEFFFPTPGDRTTLLDASTTIDGVDAWQVRLRIDFHDIGSHPVIIDLVIVANDRPAYLWAIAQAETLEDSLPLIDAVITSAHPI